MIIKIIMTIIIVIVIVIIVIVMIIAIVIIIVSASSASRWLGRTAQRSAEQAGSSQFLPRPAGGITYMCVYIYI